MKTVGRLGWWRRQGIDLSMVLARWPVAALFAIAMLCVSPPALAGQQLLTQTEALELAFPNASEIKRETAFLDEGQLAAARQIAGGKIPVRAPVVTYYVARSGGRVLGVAYFDAHRVRTKQEVVMIVVTPQSRVDRIEILGFAEPPEYRAPEAWLDQFDDEKISPDLALGRDIRGIGGATLTSRAITDATRRVLALHRVIDPLGSGAQRGHPSK